MLFVYVLSLCAESRHYRCHSHYTETDLHQHVMQGFGIRDEKVGTLVIMSLANPDVGKILPQRTP